MTSTTSEVAEHPGALPLRAGAWELDLAHSTVSFTIRHLGIAKVRGRFTGFGAEVVVADTAAASTVVASVDLSSVDTGNADRDTHIRSDDIVDVERRPTITFRSTDITGVDEEWTMTGELTIGDITRPITLDVELGGIADFPLGGPRHAGVTATGEIRRSDFGIAPGFPPPVLGDAIKVELDLELLEPVA
jgi:polyisoprenoid-binding protein YceI